MFDRGLLMASRLLVAVFYFKNGEYSHKTSEPGP